MVIKLGQILTYLCGIIESVGTIIPQIIRIVYHHRNYANKYRLIVDNFYYCVGHQGAAGGVQGPSYYSASLRYPLCLPECSGQCSPSLLIVVPIFYTNNNVYIHVHVQLYLCVCVLILYIHSQYIPGRPFSPCWEEPGNEANKNIVPFLHVQL